MLRCLLALVVMLWVAPARAQAPPGDKWVLLLAPIARDVGTPRGKATALCWGTWLYLSGQTTPARVGAVGLYQALRPDPVFMRVCGPVAQTLDGLATGRW